jgi:uncharacterized tellurite resistance protein B-like protein
MSFLNRIINALEKKVETTPPADNTFNNPISNILKQHTPLAKSELEVAAAKTGFLMHLIYSDGNIDELELKKLKILLKRYFVIPDAFLEEAVKQLIDLDIDKLQLYYLAKVLNQYLDEADRKDFLADLFQMARADQEYSNLEEKDIRTISQYLFLEHTDFIEKKNQN